MVQSLGLEQIHKRNFDNKFPMPNLSRNVEYISGKRDTDGSLITMGIIKKLHEAIFITDLTKSKYKRIKAIKEVSDELERVLNAIGSEQVHVFVNIEDKDFAMLLCNKFGFRLVRDIPLVRNLDG